jgi:hypothetical protein
MDTLRTLSSAFLLAFICTSAFAQTITFDVTNGSMTHFLNGDYPYTIAGPGFSSSGDITPEIPLDLDSPVGPGSFTFVVDGNTATYDLAVTSLTVHGVPLDTSQASALSAFSTTVVFGAHPGTYHSPFTFFGVFVECDPTTCTGEPSTGAVKYSGSGVVTWNLVPDPNFPGSFDISKATFTFKAPEPSTASLLLIAFGVLGFSAWTRMRREQRI